MSTPYQRTGRPRHPDILTPAEWDVLAGVRDGLPNSEIARRRGSSLETVRFHLRNVRAKLGVRSREALRQWPGRPTMELEAARPEQTWRIREQIPLLAVRDMQRALAFYRDALGFEVVSQYPDPPEEPGWAALGSGAARVMLHAGHHRRDIPMARPAGSVTLSLYLDGLDDLHADLLAAGYRPSTIERMPYGARECYINDPDGHELALVEFRASDPRYVTQKAGGPS